MFLSAAPIEISVGGNAHAQVRFSRDSPDDSRLGVNVHAFPAFPHAQTAVEQA